MPRSALIIFFKWAKANKVKTRLAPALSPDDAAALYAAFVKDTFAKVRALKDIEIFGYVSGMLGNGNDLEAHLHAQSLTLREQQGTDLGERMHNAFQELFQDGFQRVVIIGTDSPDLPLNYITAAFDSLHYSPHALCIGPAADGGYYLLGMNHFFPEVFQSIPYSSSETYRATLHQIIPLSVRLFTLRRWYDIDTLDDLLRLSQNLQPDLLPFTSTALARIRLTTSEQIAVSATT
ncbi:MAG: TIGR04282 family arsenosugar biosynthesis glycosyltransferase [Candidatus Thermochlorobacter sp.]